MTVWCLSDPTAPPVVLPSGRSPLSRLRELVGRTRSEDGLAAVLDAGPASGDWIAPDGAWDWDAAWAASQADTDTEDADTDGTDTDEISAPIVHEADPELERLRAEEEESERRTREHHEPGKFHGDEDSSRCATHDARTGFPASRCSGAARAARRPAPRVGSTDHVDASEGPPPQGAARADVGRRQGRHQGHLR